MPTVRLLLEHKAEVNLADSSGATPLIAATKLGRSQIVQLLLAHGADVSLHNNEGRNASQYAIRTGNRELFALLGGTTPFSLPEAARFGSVGAVREALAKGANPNDYREVGDSPLALAAIDGNVEIAKMLVGHGAKVNAIATGLQSPLHMAIWFQNDKFAEFLLDHGASIEERSGFPGDPAMSPVTPLEVAILAADPGRVSLLLRRGANVHAGKPGERPIEFAASYLGDVGERDSWLHDMNEQEIVQGKAKVIDLLLNAIDVRKESGSALISASLEGHDEIIAKLLDKGADVNGRVTTKENGITPLIAAVETFGHSERELREDMITPKLKSIVEAHGRMLHAAKRCVDLLLARDADINLPDNVGQTALMYSVRLRSVFAVRLLLSAGANVNLKDMKGQTALSLAQNEGFSEAIADLKAAGAK